MISNFPGCIGRSFDQICYVVRDLDAAIDYWRRVNGVETWSKVYDLAKSYDPVADRGHVDKEYWGEPEDFDFSCAYAFLGPVLIELAEHDGGRTVYKDWLEERGESMHHIGFRLTSLEEYDAALQHYHENGLVVGMAGKFVGPGGYCNWTYFDTLAQIGCFTEIYYLDGTAREQFENYRDGKSAEFMPGAPKQRAKPKG